MKDLESIPGRPCNLAAYPGKCGSIGYLIDFSMLIQMSFITGHSLIDRWSVGDFDNSSFGVKT
jgi:hypothetical protein